MTSRDRTFMRTQLAQVGIILTEPTPRMPPSATAAIAAEPVDRELVRVILQHAGAPAGELPWLVASCPSVDDALTYRAATEVAPCADCGVAMRREHAGCAPCLDTSGGSR